eukprot:gene25796-34382_t
MPRESLSSNCSVTSSTPVRRSLRHKTNVARVVTYNILSSSLSPPNHFPSCKPEYCDPDHRFDLILHKLDEECENSSIICLQEVSMKWAGTLHQYFASKGYYFIHALYGTKWNGYMGVGIAVPLRSMPKKAASPSGTWQLVVAWLLGLWLAAKLLLKIQKPKDDLWDEVTWKHNQMLCVRLCFKDSQKSFVVGTYHMPCSFRKPKLMNAHCALSAQHIHKFAYSDRYSDPYIFCGDFNIKPDSSIAYAELNGKEPDFTNFAQTVASPVFIDTLDYIFISPEWNVDLALELPNRQGVDGPLPNRKEPSDHLLIGAVLSLP